MPNVGFAKKVVLKMVLNSRNPLGECLFGMPRSIGRSSLIITPQLIFQLKKKEKMDKYEEEKSCMVERYRNCSHWQSFFLGGGGFKI